MYRIEWKENKKEKYDNLFVSLSTINYQLSTVNNVLNLLLYRIVSLFFFCLFNPRSKTNEPDDLILNLDLKPGGRNKKRKENQIN